MGTENRAERYGELMGGRAQDLGLTGEELRWLGQVLWLRKGPWDQHCITSVILAGSRATEIKIKREALDNRNQAWARSLARDKPSQLRMGVGGDTPPQSIHKGNLSFMLGASCAWNWEKWQQMIYFLFFDHCWSSLHLLLSRAETVTQLKPDLAQIYWFKSISVAMEHLLNTKFTFPVAIEVGQYLWAPAEWNMGPEAWGRDLGITS